MGLNQIINMVMRIIMRKAINSGINAGMRKMSAGGKRAQPRQQRTGTAMLENDDMGQMPGASQVELRKQRQARRAAKQARHADNSTGKISRM